MSLIRDNGVSKALLFAHWLQVLRVFMHVKPISACAVFFHLGMVPVPLGFTLSKYR